MSIVVHTEEFSRSNGGEIKMFNCRGHKMFGCKKTFSSPRMKCGDCQIMYHDLWKTLRTAR